MTATQFIKEKFGTTDTVWIGEISLPSLLDEFAEKQRQLKLTEPYKDQLAFDIWNMNAQYFLDKDKSTNYKRWRDAFKEKYLNKKLFFQ